MSHLKKYLKLGSNSRHVPVPCRYSFVPDQGGEGCVLINAADFTYEYFQLLVNRPETAYTEFHHLKVAYDECQMRYAEAQAKYTADLNHKNQKIAHLEMHVEEMARSRDQEAMLHVTTSSGLTQSGGTYDGSITTSSGHVRQGNDLAGKLVPNIYLCTASGQLAKDKTKRYKKPASV